MKSKQKSMKCHVKEKKKFKAKEDEVLVSIGINPMVFFTCKLVLKVSTNVIFISCHNYLIELVKGIKVGEKKMILS